ncbi:GNAT family N-acetyltransferase [Marinomonas balearica]|nr:GNAT family N-acetyltransferase [Marinomonas balearica]
MEIKKIAWQDTIPIRHKVLWPDKPPEFCHVKEDESGDHFGVLVQDELVCVASVFIDGQSARLRKFATLETHQGNGIGTTVVNHILKELSAKGVNNMWFDARESVTGFYSRFGFNVIGERFYKGDIPYVRMGMSF